MAKDRRKSRKIKTADELREEARERKRESLAASGVPVHQLIGDKVDDFREETFADLKERRKVIRALFSNQVDRWFAEGGTGFDEPQKRAVAHVRSLWAIIGNGARLTANYAPSIPGCDGDRDQYLSALKQLAEYMREFPTAYWNPFENMARFDMPAVQAGAHLARHPVERIAAARNTVGFVASKIAEWRGYEGTREAV